MKLKRMVACTLVLLLVVSILPIGAMAVDIETGAEVWYVKEPIDNNRGTIYENVSTITNNGTSGDSRDSGTVNKNAGTITNNYGTVQSNDPDDGGFDPKISHNYGLVVENYNLVENNRMKGEVASNNGTVSNNYGLVGENSNTVGTNKSTGKVSTNNGTVDLNMGTVETNNKNVNTNSGKVTENNGSITTNGSKGEIITNNKDLKYNKGTVNTNAENGTVTNNWGNIGTNDGTVNKNSTTTDTQGNEFKGVIDTNNGTIKTNAEGATVEKNLATGTIEVNDGMVGVVDEEGERVDGYGNFGTVKTNAAGGVVTDNSGSIGTNEKGAEVLENWGTIGANSGKVDFNGTMQYEYDGSGWKPLGTPAIVNNLSGGEVVENYGLVKNEAGGFLNDMTWSENPDDEEGPGITEYKQFKGEKGTYVGTWVDRGYIQNEDGSPEGFQNGGVYQVLKQAIQGAVMDLKEVGKLFNQDGYEVIGYSTVAFTQTSDPVVVHSTEYTVSEGDWLSLVWGKIKTIVKPSAEPETKPVQSNVPTSVAAEDVKVGTVVRAKGQIFKVIEMDDGSITVVTLGKLSKKDLEDLMAYLAKFLTPEQIELLLGNPEQISEELAAKLFGGNTNHIVFKAAKNLFA